jgi:hypothetical protein
MAVDVDSFCLADVRPPMLRREAFLGDDGSLNDPPWTEKFRNDPSCALNPLPVVVVDAFEPILLIFLSRATRCAFFIE